MEVEAFGLGNRFFKRSDPYSKPKRRTYIDPSFVKSSNVRGLGVVDESAAAFECRLKR
ncbi:hypothetical protein YC2023_014036 [Brassica napus]